MNRTEPNSNSNYLLPMVKESIDRFLTEYRRGDTDFSNFTSIFSRFLHNLPNPPLEIVWFYSALTFHSTKFAVQESSNEVSMAKDLFQLLVSCSSSYNAVGKIAVLAPVITELCSLVIGKNCCQKEIDSLLEGIVSYMSICCGVDLDENIEFGGMSSCFAGLVRVWLVEKIGDDCKFGENLRLFFPIVGDGVYERMVSEGCEVRCLAGIVMNEAFLLKLCLKFGRGIPKAELMKELHSWAVQMISAFRSYYFVDTLLRMLLELVLPVSSLLNSEEEIILREVLYDALIMVEYSYFISQKGTRLPERRLKNLAVTWLFVANNAIRFVRENGDQTKIISYLKSFSESFLLSQLIKWVMNQSCMHCEISRPNVSTPLALIKWLLAVEDQGVTVFDSNISKVYAKTTICESRIDYELLVAKSNGKNLGENNFSYSDSKGKQEDKVDGGDLDMVDSGDAMFWAGPGLMKLTAANGARKRKEERNDEGHKQVKFFRGQLNGYSEREKVLLLGNDDGLRCGCEVDNPVSVEDMEYMEQ